jgi:hypothetical protein
LLYAVLLTSPALQSVEVQVARIDLTLSRTERIASVSVLPEEKGELVYQHMDQLKEYLDKWLKRCFSA